MKGKTKTQQGITLIALIITIVVLLILATVAVSSIRNDGIIQYATNVAKDYNKAVSNEQEMLDGYIDYLQNGGPLKKVTEVKNVMQTSNTKVVDEYGNKIVIPAGFMIRVDDSTNNADTVIEGIVIEDCTETSTKGSQFVWIPVGTIKHLDEEGKATTSNITLGRYSWSGSTGTLVQPTADNPYTSNVAIEISFNFIEYQSGSTTPTNAIARNINDFYESVMGTTTQKGNGGYYLGRYEAGDSSHTTVASRTGTDGKSTAGTLVCKANQVPYNWIMQKDASSKCQNMYADGYKSDGTGTFSSDLINSYAWDTAIMFIQTFGKKKNSSTYAETSGYSSTKKSSSQLTGTIILDATSAVDEQLNIYDMAGSCNEWSTETNSSINNPFVLRGGSSLNRGMYWTCSRYRSTPTSTTDFFAFRPLIYVGL